MIAFPCPNCQAALKAPEKKAGARTKCPKCGSPVQVPGHTLSAPPVVADILPAEDLADAPPVQAPAVASAPGGRPAKRRGFPLWILWVAIPSGLLLLLCCGGGVGLIAFIGNHNYGKELTLRGIYSTPPT